MKHLYGCYPTFVAWSHSKKTKRSCFLLDLCLLPSNQLVLIRSPKLFWLPPFLSIAYEGRAETSNEHRSHLQSERVSHQYPYAHLASSCEEFCTDWGSAEGEGQTWAWMPSRAASGCLQTRSWNAWGKKDRRLDPIDSDISDSWACAWGLRSLWTWRALERFSWLHILF